MIASYVKVKAHRVEETVPHEELWLFKANELADRLAKEGAKQVLDATPSLARAEETFKLAVTYLEAVGTMLACWPRASKARLSFPKVDRVVKPCTTRLRHDWQTWGNIWHCTQCLRLSRLRPSGKGICKGTSSWMQGLYDNPEGMSFASANSRLGSSWCARPVEHGHKHSLRNCSRLAPNPPYQGANGC